MVIVVFFIVHWYLSLFSQTFFLHRYAAHKMFFMSVFWEKFFFIFTGVTQGSSYLSPYVYGVLHRMHHAYADTELDPHSPKYSSTALGMFVKTWGIYNAIKTGKNSIDDRFKKNIPEWKAFDRFADSWIIRLFWAAFYISFYIVFVPKGAEWLYLLLPFHFFMGPLHGVIINWFGHKVGYINFKVNNTSMNLLPVDFLMMGEGYHNNHHQHPLRPNFGSRWFELDPTYPVIMFMKWIGILKIQNPA
jgi:stearoyl-CoA desaturase (delta-9 desaturase)